MITKEELIENINSLDLSGTTWLRELMHALIPLAAQAHNIDAAKLRTWIDLRQHRETVKDLIQDSPTLYRFEAGRVGRNNLCFMLNNIFSDNNKLIIWEDAPNLKLRARLNLSETEKACFKQAMIDMFVIYLETFDVACKSPENKVLVS